MNNDRFSALSAGPSVFLAGNYDDTPPNSHFVLLLLFRIFAFVALGRSFVASVLAAEHFHHLHLFQINGIISAVGIDQKK